MDRVEGDALVEALYRDLVAEIGTVLEDFDDLVATSYDHGEPEAAIFMGIVEAASAGVPVSAALIERARPLFPDSQDILDWANTMAT